MTLEALLCISFSLLCAEGYTTTESGLQYRVLTPPLDPNSPTPVRGQRVKIKYALYLYGFPADTAQAKIIDTSKGTFGEKLFEFETGVDQVYKGLDLSIVEMRTGETRQLIIPSDLGYGEKGIGGGKIPGAPPCTFAGSWCRSGNSPALTTIRSSGSSRTRSRDTREGPIRARYIRHREQSQHRSRHTLNIGRWYYVLCFGGLDNSIPRHGHAVCTGE